jgi:hypothetical protein
MKKPEIENLVSGALYVRITRANIAHAMVSNFRMKNTERAKAMRYVSVGSDLCIKHLKIWGSVIRTAKKNITTKPVFVEKDCIFLPG